MRRMIFALSTPAMPRTFTTDSCRSHAGLGNGTSHSPPRISVVMGTTTDMVRSASGRRTETTTQGLTLAAMPKSTITTSPRSNLVIINFGRGTQFVPCVGHNVFPCARRRFHFWRGHDPPAAILRRDKVLAAFPRAANANTASCRPLLPTWFACGNIPTSAGQLSMAFERVVLSWIDRRRVGHF